MKTNPPPSRRDRSRPAGLIAALGLLFGAGLVPAAEPPPTVFQAGAQTHFGQGWKASLASRLADGGITTVRDEIYWQVVEPSPGNFVFPRNYDDYMAALREKGVEPLIELTFTNTNYDGGLTPYTPAGFAAYGRYAAAVLQRYGSQIRAVEIWNEYNGSFATGPAAADRSGTYLKMLQVAYATIKSARSDVLVVGGATAGVPLPYFEKLFAAGALNYLDVVSVHPYRTAATPEGLEAQIAALRTLMTKYGTVKPIWVTEIGWPLRRSGAPGDTEIDEATQAKYLVRACVLLASAGVPRVYWYALRDESAVPFMGLLLNDPPNTSRQALGALKFLNTQLRTARFESRDPTAAGVYSLRFTDPTGRRLRILWALSPQSVPLPTGTTVQDIQGRAVAHPPGHLVLTDSPVYISGPLPGIAANAATNQVLALTDSAAGFSLEQGAYGWSYGYYVGSSTNFAPLQAKRTTDWKEEWGDRFIALSITGADQHPSKSGNQPVAAVRRWTSNVAGNVRVAAHFKCGLKGDGVRVRVLADGQELRAAELSLRTAIAADFSLTVPVRVGTTLDFAVDPGPAANIDFDATQVAVTIERVN